MKNYTQLNQENRCEIYGHQQAHKRIRQIAKKIGKNPSTISRELRRNKDECGNRPLQAQEIAVNRKRNAKKFIKMNVSLIEKINAMFIQDWSPETCSGVLAKEGMLISSE